MYSGIGTFSCTAAGDVNITSADLGGQTPKAALIISNGLTASSEVDGAGLCISLTDGSTSRSVAISARNGVGTSDVKRVNSNKPLAFDYYDAAKAYEANFSAWIENGFRVNFTNPSTSGGGAALMLASGTLRAKLVTADLNTTATSITVSGVGFQPQIILAIGTSFEESRWYRLWYGWAFVSSGGIAQCSVSQGYTDNDDSPESKHYTNNNSLGHVALSSVYVDGFTITKGAETTNETAAFLCLYEPGGFQGNMQTYLSPSSPGAVSIPMTFEPDALLHIAGGANALNTLFNSAPRSEGVAVDFATKVSDSYGVTIASKDDTGASDTETIPGARMGSVANPDGTDKSGSLTKLNSTEIELTFTQTGEVGASYGAVFAFRGRTAPPGVTMVD